jgi:hypothetical protein
MLMLLALYSVVFILSTSSRCKIEYKGVTENIDKRNSVIRF